MRTFFNFLRHNRLYTAINLLGLALSMTFILLLAVYVHKQLSTDSFQEKADRLMLIASDHNASAYHLQDYLKERYPEIESTTAFHSEDNIRIRSGEKSMYSKTGYADTAFFDMFSFKVMEGDKDSFRHSQNNVIISKTFSSKFFNGEDAIGKTFHIGNHRGIFTVTGVMEDIDRSVIPYCDVLIRGECLEKKNPSHNKEMGNSGDIQTFVLVKENADLMAKKADMLEYFKEIWWVYRAGCNKVIMMPLKDIYFSGLSFNHLNTGNRNTVNLLLTVCLVLLLFAVLNYINLTTAIIGFRAKEMASRRLLGASKGSIFLKMTGESTLMCMVAMVIAIFAAEALSPAASLLLDYNFSIFEEATLGNVAIVISSAVILGVIAGIIPAMTVQRVQPIDIVRGSFRLKVKSIYSKVIMIVQNTLTLCMVAISFTMSLQIRHMLDAPLGYNTKDILNIVNYYGNAPAIDVVKDRLLSETFVKNVGYGKGTPLHGTNNMTMSMVNDEWISFQQIIGDDGYFEILGLREKEDFNAPDMYWVNEYAMEKITAINRQSGITGNVIPAQYQKWPIGGIYYDFKIFSLLMGQSAALIYNCGTFGKDDYPWTILVEVEGDHAAAYSKIKETFAEVFPDSLFEAEYIETQISDTFSKEKKALSIISIFTIISIMISALGLLAMSTYFMMQQRKNAAIRKVLGAERATVLKGLVIYFMKYVCIAIVIGIPIAWYIAKRWLEGFSYRIDLHWWIFAASAALIILIAAASILWQSLKTAGTDPVEALKGE